MTTPTCICARCEARRFRDWRDRARDLPMSIGLPDVDLAEDTARMQLIQELHADRAWRHPLGIAQTLGGVIDTLDLIEDEEAVELLHQLYTDELIHVQQQVSPCPIGTRRDLSRPEDDR